MSEKEELCINQCIFDLIHEKKYKLMCQINDDYKFFKKKQTIDIQIYEDIILIDTNNVCATDIKRMTFVKKLFQIFVNENENKI